MIDFLAVTLLHLASLDSLAAGLVAFRAALDLFRGSTVVSVFFCVVALYHVSFFFISSFCQSNSSHSFLNLCGVHSANLK